MTEWTLLNKQVETDYDTPALVAERNDVNAEVAAIQAERQRIDLALEVVKNTPISQLTVDQMQAAQRAKEAHFQLLQRELRFRQELFPAYLQSNRTEAGQARRDQEVAHLQIEADVKHSLEAMGYRTPGHNVQGSWSDEMVFRHPKVIESRNRVQSLSDAARRHEAMQANSADTETLTRELNNVMRQMVGVSSGIPVNS